MPRPQISTITIEQIPALAYKVARAWGASHELAEDIGQDVVVQVLPDPNKPLKKVPRYLTYRYVALAAISGVAAEHRRPDSAGLHDPTEVLEGLPVYEAEAPEDDGSDLTPDEIAEQELRRLTPAERDLAEAVLAGRTVRELAHQRSGTTNAMASPVYAIARSALRKLQRNAV